MGNCKNGKCGVRVHPFASVQNRLALLTVDERAEFAKQVYLQGEVKSQEAFTKIIDEILVQRHKCKP